MSPQKISDDVAGFFPAQIKTADLVLEDLPKEGASWHVYSRFALTAAHLYRPEEDFDRLQVALAAVERGARAATVLPISIDDLRRLLHAMQRRWRWSDGREPPNIELCRAIVSAIRRAIEHPTGAPIARGVKGVLPRTRCRK